MRTREQNSSKGKANLVILDRQLVKDLDRGVEQACVHADLACIVLKKEQVSNKSSDCNTIGAIPASATAQRGA